MSDGMVLPKTPSLTIEVDETGMMRLTGPDAVNIDALVLVWAERTGRVRVNGPIGNRVVCYGLLEAAKDVVQEWHATQQSGQRVQVAPAGFILRNNGGRG